ncbi:hypothetical protein [Flagellimonas sp.]|uniref:hypothetical protein n=1 Tax=Flagellimonas sp. TaxID=2058762 RepID=UPI003BAD1039
MKRKEVKKRFKELGFEFPATEEELKAFNDKFKDYPYKLNENNVDPLKIINSIQ